MPEQGYDGDSDPLPNVFGDGPFHGADTSGGDGGGNEEWRDCRHGNGDQPDNYPDTGRPGADIYRDTKIKAFGNKSQITDIDIRIFLRDTDPAANKLLDDFEKANIKALSFWENGFRHLTNAKRSVVKVEDGKGLKIRTMENKVHLAAWKDAGLNPTPVMV